MSTIVSRLVCSGCGYEAPAADATPFRCPNAGDPDGDGRDHVLRRLLSADPDGLAALRSTFSGADPNPFSRYRELLHSYRSAIEGGSSDEAFVTLVEELDGAVAAVDGRGFRETPFLPSAELAGALGVADLWVKDETGNVSGSHKARHLFGLMLWLCSHPTTAARTAPLVIASCGNAALGAAIVARAARRELEVFVPPWADRSVVSRLEALEIHLGVCPRSEGEVGDPCYLRFREAVARGGLPFTCQGNENGLTLDGGRTLAWEMVSRLGSSGHVLDRLFVQVGGGALASATIQGLEEACRVGALERLPRIHAVQAGGAHPLERAYHRVVDRALGDTTAEAASPGSARTAERSRLVSRLSADRLDAALAHAAAHRGEYMWPWKEEPAGIATGILDDETHDWLAVVQGMLRTGGYPVTVTEAELREANDLGRSSTGIPVDHTGTAGLAGALHLWRRGELGDEESLAVLFTGVDRSHRDA